MGCFCYCNFEIIASIRVERDTDEYVMVWANGSYVNLVMKNPCMLIMIQLNCSLIITISNIDLWVILIFPTQMLKNGLWIFETHSKTRWEILCSIGSDGGGLEMKSGLITIQKISVNKAEFSGEKLKFLDLIWCVKLHVQRPCYKVALLWATCSWRSAAKLRSSVHCLCC